MSPSSTIRSSRLATVAFLASIPIAVAGCNHADAARLGEAGDAAAKVYVAPGKYDEFYAFFSGGFSGQVGVYGLPSGRLLKHVPVFSQNPENGYGYSEETKPMLKTSYGFIPWDDAHHPQLSQTERRARRTLALHQRQQHAANRPDRSDPTSRPTRFSRSRTRPATTPRRSSPRTPSTSWRRRASACRSRNAMCRSTTTRKLHGDAHVHLASTVPPARWTSLSRSRCPAFDYDLSHSGKGPSHGWSFFTSYNSEAGEHHARGQRLAERQGLHRRGQLEAGRAVRRGRARRRRCPHGTPTTSSDEDGAARTGMGYQRQDADSRCVPGPGLLPAHAEVAARRRRRSDRRVHRGRRQARHGHSGALVLEDAEGHRRQGVRRGGARDSGAEVRGDRSPARCRTRVSARCTPSSTARATPTPRCSSRPRS